MYLEANFYMSRDAEKELEAVEVERVDVRVDVSLIDPPGLVVQTWLTSLSVHFQICI